MLQTRKLLNLLAILTHQSCNIIKSAVQNPNLKRYYKNRQDDFATEADLMIQSLIMKGVKQKFPQLKVVGQEEKQYEGQISFNFDKINENILIQSHQIIQQLPFEDICLWIDPIDSTSGLINGHPQNCTILIGLSYKNIAHAGVVGIPFIRTDNNLKYQQQVIIGSVGQQKCFILNGQKLNTKRMNKPFYIQGQTTKVSISNSHLYDKVPYQQIVKKMNANMIWTSGIGKKLMMLAKGDISLLVFLPIWTCMWDTCGPEAIIKSLGGYYTDVQGKPFIYNQLAKDKTNKKGFIASLNQSLQKKGYQINELSDGPHA